MNAPEAYRWIYRDPENVAENAVYAVKLAQIDAFWQAFSDLVEKSGFERAERVMDTILAELPKVSPEIMWEVSQPEPGHYTLVLTPESQYHLHPLVQTMIDRAPTFKNIRVTNYREPDNFSDLKELLLSRVSRFVPGVRARATITKYNAIDITFVASQFSNDNAEADLHYCFVACESLLGQHNLEHWVYEIKVVSGLPKSLPDAVDLSEFSEHFLKLKNQILSGLPDVPLQQIPDENAGLFKIRKGERATCVSSQPKLMIAALSNRPFFSIQRFSKFNEHICYLKIDESELAHRPDRAALEDLLDARLKEANLGCAMGGGWGPIFSFVDLALTDIEKSVPIFRAIAHQMNLPKRSWLLFYEPALSREWIGLYEDSPVPDLVSSRRTL